MAYYEGRGKRMIRVEDLHFSYGTKEVLKGISFEADKGEFLCILGHNGAGKSTLFKCILGLLKGYTGRVTADGQELSKMKPAERARLIAYIPQAANPAFAYSVMDMVLMGTAASLSGRMSPGEKERKTAENVLSRLGISEMADRSYAEISGGEQQLVLIARALAQGAKILIMDEPTSSLDYGNQMRVQKQLRELISEGYTIIQSTHDPEQAYTFADKVVSIKDGKVYREGSPEEILDDELIRALYNIDVEMISSDDLKARFFVLKEK